jgi:hypothetical protein
LSQVVGTEAQKVNMLDNLLRCQRGGWRLNHRSQSGWRRYPQL